MPRKYSALIVDPDLANRGRLKAVMRAVPLFDLILSAGTLPEASASLTAERVDLIFLSARLGDADIAAFINCAKAEPHGRDSACVLLLEGRRSSLAVAKKLCEGADGILLEPYSVQSLHEMIELAERVKTERLQVRIKAALHVLVREIAAQLAQIAALRKSGGAAGISQAILKEMCSVLGELDGEMRELYYDTILEIFTQLPPPQQPRRDTYRGVSQRVRKHCSQRAIQSFKKALAG